MSYLRLFLPVPKTNQRELPQEVVRMEANFTSYLAETELQNDGAPQVSKDVAGSTVTGWNSVLDVNDNSAGSDSPPFGTLESPTKDLNMLTRCPLTHDRLATPMHCTIFRGKATVTRASQLRNTPFSGESTDSSDNDSSVGDYCTPPDELSAGEEHSEIQERTDKVLEETTQVLKTCATYTTVSLKKEDQRKEGYLTKLGGRVKNWKKRWFVLGDGKLYYYKTEVQRWNILFMSSFF
ncbi:Pleckstrin y domain-containing H member 2 [Desmophyllum pertusum]|uniref:Pleckstrin y domain-containing H member 2 n=1 Tax=Desmophyllum pertusum TaxID=174260 RepID=A0A9W9YLM9_9CNID|nr:Pleckstrin y domain-containing H member 2 [Desmophyllum pertusum]